MKNKIIPYFIGMAGAFIFGVMDNGIMILAGGEIDSVIRNMGFDTMTAAGLGNTLSDGVGVLSGGAVMKILKKYFGASGDENLLQEFIGIVLGCMLPVFVYATLL
jgi:hypothetical protein